MLKFQMSITQEVELGLSTSPTNEAYNFPFFGALPTTKARRILCLDSL
jgi:hypothetical protein